MDKAPGAPGDGLKIAKGSSLAGAVSGDFDRAVMELAGTGLIKADDAGKTAVVEAPWSEEEHLGGKVASPTVGSEGATVSFVNGWPAGDFFTLAPPADFDFRSTAGT